jgi:predicted transcriptional regulator
MAKDKKELVIELLKKNTDGLTVIEISRLLSISRNTSAGALAGLEGSGIIRVREVGRAKLNYFIGGKK